MSLSLPFAQGCSTLPAIFSPVGFLYFLILPEILPWLPFIGFGVSWPVGALYMNVQGLMPVAPVVQVVNLEFYLCLSPGFEPQVGRTLTLFAKIKNKKDC